MKTLLVLLFISGTVYADHLMLLGNGYTIMDDNGNIKGSITPDYAGGVTVQDQNGNPQANAVPDYNGGYYMNDTDNTKDNSQVNTDLEMWANRDNQ